MINLAGNKDADGHIQEELIIAGIPLVKGERSTGEVPYSITGKLGSWTFGRAWRYWVAHAPDSKGLSLEIAAELHERKYPLEGENQPKNYGQVIRVAGHCGCPHPKEWVNHFDEQGNQIILDPDGKQEKQYKEFLAKHPRFVDASGEAVSRVEIFAKSLDEIKGLKSLIHTYHIDNQLGLNEFAKVLRA